MGDTYNNSAVVFRTSRGIVSGAGGNGRVFGLPSDVGIKDKMWAPNQLLIFPNPAEQLVYFKGKFENSTAIHFTIKDVEGKVVMNLPQQYLNHGELNTVVNISKLSNGVYFVFVDDGVNSFVKRLMVTH